jgi:phage-related protein
MSKIKILTCDIQLGIIKSMKVYFYETAAGSSPIKKFIDGLPKQDQARFFEVIAEVELHRLAATRMVFKPMEGKLWEIKFRAANSGYRVFYVLLEKDMMIWLHAFSKKSQKTPPQELEMARKRLKALLRS